MIANVPRPTDRVAGQLDPGLVERSVGFAVGRHQPHLDSHELLEPEVGTRIEPQHIHVIRDLGDEGQEQRPVQPTLVKILGRDVGGRHHDGAEFEQLREQPPQDHRVGNVGDVKLVEAQQPCVVEDRLCGKSDHVGIDEFAARDALAKTVDTLMHVGHELVEMGTALVHDRAVLEEQVHQHGLAAPDLAVNVEAARRLLLVGEQPAEQALLAHGLVGHEPALEAGKGVGNLGLGRVGFNCA